MQPSFTAGVSLLARRVLTQSTTSGHPIRQEIAATTADFGPNGDVGNSPSRFQQAVSRAPVENVTKLGSADTDSAELLGRATGIART